MSDRIFALVWLGVCALIFVQMWSLVVPFTYEPLGPKAFPMLLSGLMALCCIILIVNPDDDSQWPEFRLLAKGASLICVLLGYSSLFEILGFPLATAVMVLLVSRLFGGSWLSSLVSTVSISILGYLIFDQVLEVSLPLGRIWG